jgi:hypothetical protein
MNMKMEAEIPAESRGRLLGRPLHQSSLWSCATLSYFRCNDVIFFRPTGHYVRTITRYFNNIAFVYHIVAMRMI